MKQITLCKHFLPFLLFLILSTAVFSIGFSPPRFVAEVLPGSVLEETIVINLLEVESKVIYVSVKGEAKEWIQYKTQLLVPENQESLESKFKIQIPESIPIGNYSATIDYLIPGKKNVDLAFSVPIELIVTNKKNVDYTVRNLKATQEKNLSFSFTLYNKGNSNFGPTGAVITVMDNLRKNTVYEGTQDIKAVKAFTTKNMLLDFGTALPKGNYWVDFSIPPYGYEESVFLEVDQATSEQKIEVTDPIYRVNSSLIIILIGFIMVLIFVAYAPRRLRKKSK